MKHKQWKKTKLNILKRFVIKKVKLNEKTNKNTQKEKNTKTINV